jgi:tetratricopeptide (TPR) repeat protein
MSSGCAHSAASSTSGRPIDAIFEPDAGAAEALREIEKTPSSPVGYQSLAAVYMKRWRETGDPAFIAKSQSAVDRGLGVKPDDQLLRKFNASLHLSSHRFAEALELGKQLESEMPNDQFVYGVLTDANTELGNYPDAVRAAQKMVDLKPNSVSYARVANIRSLHGDHAGAVEAYKLAAKTADPADHEAQAWCLSQLGNELWKSGKYTEANAVFDEALQIFAGYHLAVAGKGRVLASLGDLEQAAKTLIEAQNRLPNADTVIMLGDVYSKLGDTDKGAQQAALVEVVEQKLGLAGDQKRLALFWADNDTKLTNALEIAEREHAVRKDIFTADVYAWCLLKNNRANDAAKIIEQAMRLKTGDARILYHAGMIANAQGKKTDAKRLLTLALKTNPVFDLKQAEIARRTATAL